MTAPRPCRHALQVLALPSIHLINRTSRHGSRLTTVDMQFARTGREGTVQLSIRPCSTLLPRSGACPGRASVYSFVSAHQTTTQPALVNGQALLFLTRSLGSSCSGCCHFSCTSNPASGAGGGLTGRSAWPSHLWLPSSHCVASWFSTCPSCPRCSLLDTLSHRCLVYFPLVSASVLCFYALSSWTAAPARHRQPA